MIKKFEYFNSNSGLKKEDFYWESKFDVFSDKVLTMGDDYRYDTGEEFKRVSFTQDEISQIEKLGVEVISEGGILDNPKKQWVNHLLSSPSLIKLKIRGKIFSFIYKCEDEWYFCWVTKVELHSSDHMYQCDGLVGLKKLIENEILEKI
jgi:hypothetical protein